MAGSFAFPVLLRGLEKVLKLLRLDTLELFLWPKLCFLVELKLGEGLEEMNLAPPRWVPC